MSNTTSSRTQAERADQTRTRILDAAIKEFSAHGLAGARTEQIAEAAGVNKALLYYYFHGKEALYAAALEAVGEEVRSSSMVVLESSASPGERFLRAILTHFDRIHSRPGIQALLQHEMIRLHRGESNALTPLAQKALRPVWLKLKSVIEEGVAAGELISAEWTQMIYASLGANVFYFLSAPAMNLSLGENPLERGAIEFRRRATLEYLGQAVFVDRAHGARIAAHVLAEMTMPDTGAFQSGAMSLWSKKK